MANKLSTTDVNENDINDMEENSRLLEAGIAYRKALLAKNTPSVSDDEWKGYTEAHPYDTNNV